MKIRAEMGRSRAPLWPREYQVDKVVELPNTVFASFMIQPLDHYDFIEHNRVEPHQGTGHDHCLLVLSDECADGALVQCGDDGQAMYAAYVAGARDILRAKLDRVADFIIQRCTANTGAGSWQVHFNKRPARGNCRVPFEELEEQLGLVIRAGNGLDAMLLDALRRRPEVSAVELDDGCVSAAYDLGLRHDKAAPEERTAASFSTERAEELFENAVSVALELYQGEECYSIHTLKTGAVITFTTKLGARTYAVTGVSKVSVNDVSGLDPSAANMVTLYTCVNDQPAFRWCVTAQEI